MAPTGLVDSDGIFSGTLGLGGANERAAEICFDGELSRPFVNFVISRAKRLGLKLGYRIPAPSVLVGVEGPEALVDSFEITCSLGPIDARIERRLRCDRLPSTAQAT